jgi:AcrR family transcriptional regulator
MEKAEKTLFRDLISEAKNNTGVLNARERSRLETRRRLLQAGAELFSMYGYEKTNVAAIASEAQVATGTLFFHFKNKEGLLAEIALYYFNELHDRIRESNRRPAVNIEHSVRMRIETIVSFIEANKTLFSIIFNQITTGLDVWDNLSQVWVNEQRDRLIEGIAEGLFRDDIDIEIATQGMIGMHFRVLSWWLNHPLEQNKEKLIDTLTKITFSGIYKSSKQKAVVAYDNNQGYIMSDCGFDFHEIKTKSG